MKILLLGSGGREHAMCWALARSPRVDAIVAVPGNAGMANHATLVAGNPENPAEMADLAEAHGVDLTIVGPEAPLVAGVVDEFRRRGLKIAGHSQAAAMLEGSKIFSKEFMTRHGIPTARFVTCASPEHARDAVRNGGFGFPVVLKADGLAAGKGVVIAATVDEADAAIESMMVDRALGDAANRLLIEEALSGREASMFYFTDGIHIIQTPAAQDYKRIGDGDAGPNTGGMGSFSVAGLVDAELESLILREIAEPTVRGMREEGTPLTGLLYVGLMLTAEGPLVLEYNVRFGDPETQSVLLRLDSDLLDLFEGIADGSLEGIEPKWSPDAALCLVLASAGYPGPVEKGRVIAGLAEAGAVEGVTVFHAGTTLGSRGETVTAGGRVLGVAARGESVAEARERAYRAAGLISFDGMQYRSDIGAGR